MLSEEEKERYRRQLILDEVGEKGQEKLKNAKVLVIGTGGLGSPVCLYLTAAGVGHIGIVDADVVDRTNLQRQVIHFTKDLNRPKVESAKEKMNALNPSVEVTAYHRFLDENNAEEIMKPWDFIIDGTDNLPAKFLINDTCVKLGKPFAHGGLLRWQGQAFTHLPGTADLRSYFKEPPPPGVIPPASQSGIMGATAGMLGTVLAAEAIKYCLGTGDLLTNRMLTIDVKTMTFRNISL